MKHPSPPPAPASLPVDLGCLCDYCSYIAAQYPVCSENCFAPSTRQISFFSLVWTAKLGAKVGARSDALVDKHGASIPYETLAEHTEEVSVGLERDGSQVAWLKFKDEKEWELLRIQLEKTLRRFDCPMEMKQDAQQNALLSLYRLVDRLPAPAELEAAADILQYAAAVDRNPRPERALAKLYGFDRLFYAYAKRAAGNAMTSLLRHADDTQDDEFWTGILAPEDETGSEDQAAETDSQSALLRLLLQQLFGAIETQLTPKQREVIRLTLAARPQFWRGLRVAGLAPPTGLEPLPPSTSDADIGSRCGATANTVRATRSMAKDRLQDPHGELARLVEVLLDARWTEAQAAS